MQGSSDAIIVHDLRGKMLAWNHGAQALYGYAEAEVARRARSASLLPDERRGAYDAADAQRARRAARAGAESKRRTRDGA